MKTEPQRTEVRSQQQQVFRCSKHVWLPECVEKWCKGFYGADILAEWMNACRQQGEVHFSYLRQILKQHNIRFL